MARLLNIFFNVDLRCSHDGLKALCAKKRVGLSKLEQGDCVIFINRDMTKLKMFASGTECLLHLKKEKGRIAPETIPLLPHYVSGGKLDYNSALKTAIEKHLQRRKSRGQV